MHSTDFKTTEDILRYGSGRINTQMGRSSKHFPIKKGRWIQSKNQGVSTTSLTDITVITVHFEKALVGFPWLWSETNLTSMQCTQYCKLYCNSFQSSHLPGFLHLFQMAGRFSAGFDPCGGEPLHEYMLYWVVLRIALFHISGLDFGSIFPSSPDEGHICEHIWEL